MYNCLIDSHCHLHLLLDQAPHLTIEEILLEARMAKVAHMLCVGTNIEDSAKILKDWEGIPSISFSAGLHPLETLAPLTSAAGEASYHQLAQLVANVAVKAVGETGLDLNINTSNEAFERQRQWFTAQLHLAKQHQKPIIIHSRHAMKEVLSLLKGEGQSSVEGVIHCFTEDKFWAKCAVDLGLKISFSGILTFKNAQAIREAAAYLPLESILIETDAPYLAPVPLRGKTNRPAYVSWVAQCLADLKKMSWSEIAQQTTQNFCETFKISQPEGLKI